MEELDKKVKNFDTWDIALTKLAVAAGVLFIIGIWPAARNWAFTINPWWFLVAAVIFAIRPLIRMFK